MKLSVYMIRFSKNAEFVGQHWTVKYTNIENITIYKLGRENIWRLFWVPQKLITFIFKNIYLTSRTISLVDTHLVSAAFKNWETPKVMIY